MNKGKNIIYWIATLWLCLGMLSTGLVQLFKTKEGTGGLDDMTHLGYPAYFLTIVGIWKLLGVTALIMPKAPLLKEWAYAGFFFLMSGAIISHITSGDPMMNLLPALLLLVLTVLSWYLRPVNKKFAFNNQ